MKVWGFNYCDCIYEGAAATMSLHKTKQGAQKAMSKHKALELVEFKKLKAFHKKIGCFDSHVEFGEMESWSIQEVEVNN